MTPIRIVGFNGLGQPTVEGVSDGDILILVQASDVSIVKLELLPPQQYGPSLDHATNQSALVDDARAAVQAHHPDLIDSERQWTLECPPELSERATFRS